MKNNNKKLLENTKDINFDIKNNDIRIIMQIISTGKYNSSKIKKDVLFSLFNYFNLEEQDKSGFNVLMYILFYNKLTLRINKNEILGIMNRFNLKQQNKNQENALMIIMAYNESNMLFFNKSEIFSILNRFDLSQKNNNNLGIYDFFIDSSEFLNEVGDLTKVELELLISKLDIEEVDGDNNNILIKELNNNLEISNDELIQKILNTKNNDIIQCVYSHIDKIKWKNSDLLFFLNKNKLQLNDKSSKLLI